MTASTIPADALASAAAAAAAMAGLVVLGRRAWVSLPGVMIATAAGTVLACAATAAACLYFGLPAAGWPRMPARHPLASYLALAHAPFSNWLTLAVLTWAVFAATFLVTGAAACWLARRRQPAPEDEETA